jgi:hypothetical protein
VDADGYPELDYDVSHIPFCVFACCCLLMVCRMWLPGAEAGLRWLRRAHIETLSAPHSFCTVPLGISSFRTHGASTPVMWGASSWPITWVKRHQEFNEMPAWEAPVQLAKDMRECFGRLLDGQMGRSPELMV